MLLATLRLNTRCLQRVYTQHTRDFGYVQLPAFGHIPPTILASMLCFMHL